MLKYIPFSQCDRPGQRSVKIQFDTWSSVRNAEIYHSREQGLLIIGVRGWSSFLTWAAVPVVYFAQEWLNSQKGEDEIFVTEQFSLIFDGNISLNIYCAISYVSCIFMSYFLLWWSLLDVLWLQLLICLKRLYEFRSYVEIKTIWWELYVAASSPFIDRTYIQSPLSRRVHIYLFSCITFHQ